MKKRMILAAGAIAALVLVGCQNQQSQTQTNVSETEKLKEQIALLEQQITELKQQTPDSQTYDHELYNCYSAFYLLPKSFYSRQIQ